MTFSVMFLNRLTQKYLEFVINMNLAVGSTFFPDFRYNLTFLVQHLRGIDRQITCRTSGKLGIARIPRIAACYLLRTGYLLGLFVNAEDGGCMFPERSVILNGLHGVIFQKIYTS
jgi:hypothetical protein